MHNEPNTTKEKKANNWPWLWFPSFYACQPSRPLQFREWELWSGPGFHLTGKGFLGVYDWFRSLRLYDPCGENMNKVFGPFDEAACRRPPWQWKLLTANWRFSLPALCVSYSYSYGLCSDMSLIFGGRFCLPFSVLFTMCTQNAHCPLGASSLLFIFIIFSWLLFWWR